MTDHFYAFHFFLFKRNRYSPAFYFFAEKNDRNDTRSRPIVYFCTIENLCMIQKRATLGRAQRLKSDKLIRRVLSARMSVACFPLRMLWQVTETEKNTVAAFIAPKKNFRHAVDRNRVKRLMREAYRTSREQYLAGEEKKYAFIFMCNGQKVPDFSTVKKCTERLFSLWREKITPDKP